MIPSVPSSAALAMVSPERQQGRDLALVMAMAARMSARFCAVASSAQPCVHLPGRHNPVHQDPPPRSLAQDRRARQTVGGVIVIGDDAPRHRRAQPVEIAA
jgi:hypothetical protein